MNNILFRGVLFTCLIYLLTLPLTALGDSPPKQGGGAKRHGAWATEKPAESEPLPAEPAGGAPRHGAWATEKPAASEPLPDRAALENKLQVEQVLVKGRGEKGVEIEVRYRIVDVEDYAAHPKVTFVADETSKTLVALSKLQQLFTPAPAEQAVKMPAAVLTFWDKNGAIRPGQPVTVVVAGYGQINVIPEAGPGYDPQASATKMSATKRSQLAAPGATLVVHEAKVVAGGHLLNVRFSTRSVKSLDPDPDKTYVENPETGQRHPVVKVPRIGSLAPKELEKAKSSFMVIDNAGHRIKGGQRINVVVSGVRSDNVLVTEE